jgi:hypothetical protein
MELFFQTTASWRIFSPAECDVALTVFTLEGRTANPARKIIGSSTPIISKIQRW